MSRRTRVLAGDTEEELSDYRVVLSCMRRRLEGYGMTDALRRLEMLDDAILEAIRQKQSAPRTLN